VWYGPDTYMGRNLAQLFTMLSTADEADIKSLHPAHTRATIRALLPRLRYFDAGTCIVHHIFGGEVCELVREGYGDAFLTAHFEVPGEMFTLAMEAKARGMGCVGSTSNILDFISGKLKVGSGVWVWALGFGFSVLGNVGVSCVETLSVVKPNLPDPLHYTPTRPSPHPTPQHHPTTRTPSPPPTPTASSLSWARRPA